MITKNIHHIGERTTAFVAALTAALPARHIKFADLRNYDDYDRQELGEGIIVVLSSGESDYSNNPGMIAKEATQRFILAGKIKCDERATGLDVFGEEVKIIEEVKEFLRSNVPGMSLNITASHQSRQLDKPYAWTLQHVDVGPNTNSIS